LVGPAFPVGSFVRSLSNSTSNNNCRSKSHQ
jgi:hypothetical protein